MAGPYTIATPVTGQPVPSALFGQSVKDAINDLHIRTAALEVGSQAIIARGRRLTSSGTFTTTETPYFRLDNIPVRAGKLYRVNTSNINLNSTVVNDVARANVRVAYSATTGTFATIASPLIGLMRNTIDTLSQTNTIPINTFYVSPSDGYISLLISAVRTAGSGNITFYSSATEWFDMTVELSGTDPGDTGVSL